MSKETYELQKTHKRDLQKRPTDCGLSHKPDSLSNTEATIRFQRRPMTYERDGKRDLCATKDS